MFAGGGYAAWPYCERDGESQIIVLFSAFGADFQGATRAAGGLDMQEFANQGSGFAHAAHYAEAFGFEQRLQARRGVRAFGTCQTFPSKRSLWPPVIQTGASGQPGCAARSISTTGIPTPVASTTKRQPEASLGLRVQIDDARDYGGVGRAEGDALEMTHDPFVARRGLGRGQRT